MKTPLAAMELGKDLWKIVYETEEAEALFAWRVVLMRKPTPLEFRVLASCASKTDGKPDVHYLYEILPPAGEPYVL